MASVAETEDAKTERLFFQLGFRCVAGKRPGAAAPIRYTTLVFLVIEECFWSFLWPKFV